MSTVSGGNFNRNKYNNEKIVLIAVFGLATPSLAEPNPTVPRLALPSRTLPNRNPVYWTREF